VQMATLTLRFNMKPLYMWAGGKNKMIPKYQKSPGIPLSGYDTFVEPFFGGGAMMIYIYENNPDVKKFVMNDINPEIVGIYRAIKTDVEAFVARMEVLSKQYLPLSKEDRKVFYYALRKEYGSNWSQWTSTDESATLYFLMKTGFNGIWQTCKESQGRFGTPSGLLNQTTHVYDKANVLEWHTMLQKVDIHCGNWDQCVTDISGKTLFFLDPPYRDSFTSYGQIFDDAHQMVCIDFCKLEDSKGNWVMLCNRDSEDKFFKVNQGSLSIEYYDVTYTAGRRKQNKDEDGNITSQSAKSAKEVLLYSPALDSLVKVVPEKKKTKTSKKDPKSKKKTVKLIDIDHLTE
jgi:DNA adenine methylase